MSFPDGVQVVTVTLETPLSAAGETGVFSGCQLEIDRKVIHGASGQTLYPNPVDVTPATPGDPVTFQVPYVDQDGFVDASGGAITGWHYVLSGAVQFGALKAQRFTPKPFQPLVGQTGPISLDLIPDGVAVPATVTVNLAITAETLRATAAEEALQGDVDDVTAGLAAHLVAADPHPQYLTPTEANGAYDAVGAAAAAQSAAVSTAAADATAKVGAENTRALAAEALAAMRAQNLADLASASAARGNLGLGTAAVHATGDFDAAGAAAAVQALALLKAANLSDVANAGTARTNLGLGTIATHAASDFDSAGAATAAQTAAQAYADAAVAVEASARTAAITAALDLLRGGSLPGLIDTLAEIDAAIGNDPNFATTMTTALAGKQAHSAALDTLATTPTSTFGLALLALADSPAARAALGLGSAALQNSAAFDAAGAAASAQAASQPGDATLTGLASVTTAADKLIYATGVDTFAVTDLSAFVRTLLDDGNAATARGTLGLGGAAVLNVGTTAGTVAAGDDSRLSDTRTPTDGTVTAAKVAGSLKPSGTAATTDEALRALGTTGSTAAAGNDSRLSDARTPTAHASTHNLGGADALTFPCRLLATSTPTISPGVVNTVAESNLFALTVAAAQVAAGDVLLFEGSFDSLNNSGSASTLTLRFKLGATTVVTSNAISLAANAIRYAFTIRVSIILASLSDQRWAINVFGSTASTVRTLVVAESVVHSNSSAEDLTADKTLAITGQLGTAASTIDVRPVAGALYRMR